LAPVLGVAVTSTIVCVPMPRMPPRWNDRVFSDDGVAAEVVLDRRERLSHGVGLIGFEIHGNASMAIEHGIGGQASSLFDARTPRRLCRHVGLEILMFDATRQPFGLVPDSLVLSSDSMLDCHGGIAVNLKNLSGLHHG